LRCEHFSRPLDLPRLAYIEEALRRSVAKGSFLTFRTLFAPFSKANAIGRFMPLNRTTLVELASVLGHDLALRVDTEASFAMDERSHTPFSYARTAP
jgi:hypothetical protein